MMIPMHPLRLAAFALFLLLVPHSGASHPLAPALLEIKALDQGLAEVTWKTSKLRPRGVDIQPILPPECPPVSEGEMEEGDQSVTLRWLIDCGPSGLSLIHI